MRYKNWNPYTADEPDPNPGLRDDAIEDCAEKYMADADWIREQFEDGNVGSSELFKAIAAPYRPGATHGIIGGHVIDILWRLAKQQSEHDVDSGDFEDWRYEP